MSAFSRFDPWSKHGKFMVCARCGHKYSDGWEEIQELNWWGKYKSRWILKKGWRLFVGFQRVPGSQRDEDKTWICEPCISEVILQACPPKPTLA